MNNKKTLSIAVVLFSFWGNCFAETKVGIGTGVLSTFSGYYGGTLSVPIKINSKYLIEPFIGFRTQSSDTDQTLPNYGLNNQESYQIGIGLFKLKKLNTEFELYYGAALAAGSSKFTSETLNTNISGSTSFNKRKTETSEYMIKPTLGISYLINENFTFSVDSGIFYYWGEQKTHEERYFTSTPPPIVDKFKYTNDIDGFNTFTRFIFRMTF